MVIIDLIITLFQGIFIGYALNKCLGENDSKKFWMIVFIVIFMSSDAICNFYGNFRGYASIISNLLIIMLIAFIYKNHVKESLAVCSICTLILNLFFIITSNIILAAINMIFDIKDIERGMIFVVYIPQFLLILLLIKKIDIIQRFYKFIIYESMEISMIVISIVSYFIVVFYRMTLGEYNQLIKNSLEILFGICLVSLVLHFNNIYNKTQKILVLNKALESKNNELRKIKHDYGAQISYLYGLALMDRYDDIKKSLKNIINVNQNTADAVEIKMSKEKKDKSILEMALKTATDKGIHVILEEEYDIKSIRIDEMELYRIVSNIINNAIKAMNGQGIIIVKAYELMNKVIIELQNNGPKIPDENIESIFQAGFTTKENNDMSHGYGLSIVKELVEKNNGKITVKSTEKKTSFKICFNMI